MSTAATPVKPTAAKNDAQSDHRKVKLLYAVLLVIVGALSMPAFIFCLLGFLPSIAAWVWDRRTSKSAAYTVVIFNLAGLIPVLVKVIPLGWNIVAALHFLQDMGYWLTIYVCAGMGWALLMILPLLVKTAMLQRIKSAIAHNHHQQEELVRIWGRRIVTDNVDMPSEAGAKK